jgi:hypothetical protein
MTPSALVQRTLAVALWLAPALAHGTPIYGSWALVDATTATVSLPDGRSGTFTGFPTAASSGGGGTVVPAMPGLPSGTRPSTLTFFTSAAAGTDPNAGDMIFSLDLGSWGIDGDTTFSIEDILDRALYRLELLDTSLAALPLASVQLSQHNLFFTGGAVSDYDLSLDAATGVITVVQVHDSGDPAAGRHSGMAIFSNLPASTRYVRLFVAGTGSTTRDGLRLTLSASSLPEPAGFGLLAAAFAALGYSRARGVAKPQ